MKKQQIPLRLRSQDHLQSIWDRLPPETRQHLVQLYATLIAQTARSEQAQKKEGQPNDHAKL